MRPAAEEIPRPGNTMNIGDWIKKVCFVDLFKGLSITLRAGLTKAVTERYPKQRPKIYDRFRGEPRMMRDEGGKTLCIACNLCALACPEGCIQVEREKDPETKKFVLKGYVFDMQRCMFCGLCQEACPTDCLRLTRDFELARYDRVGFALGLNTLEQGQEKTVYKR